MWPGLVVLVCCGALYNGEAISQPLSECDEDCEDVEYAEEIELDHSALFSADSTAASEEKQNNFLKEFIGDNRKVTLRQELSYLETPVSHGIETNRSSIRLEWDKLITENIYFKVDGKSIVYWSVDRRAELNEETYLTRFPVREFYLQASKSKLSVTLGRQVIIWGESEISAVADIISPRNIADFYFTSLDESRIGQDIAAIDYYGEVGRWTFLYVANPKVDEDPVLDGDYDFDGLKIGDFDITRDQDDLDPEYGLRWRRPIGKGDFSIMAAEVASNEALYGVVESATNNDSRVKQYPRYKFLGGAANLISGDTAISLELAYKSDLPFQSTEAASGIEPRDTFEAAVSVNHNLSATNSIYIGFSNQHVTKDLSTLEDAYRDSNDIAVGWNGSFMHEVLTFRYDYQYQFQDKTAIHTASASYAATSDLFYTLDLFVLSAEDEEKFAFFEQNAVLLTIEFSF